MKRAIAAALALAGAALVAVLPGCATRSDVLYRAIADVRAPVIPPQGLVYTHFRAPLALDSTGFGSKHGAAVSHQIGLPPLPFPWLYTGLDLFSWGDASQQTAAASGGITKVEHVDYDLMIVLMVYRRFTTEVYGD